MKRLCADRPHYFRGPKSAYRGMNVLETDWSLEEGAMRKEERGVGGY